MTPTSSSTWQDREQESQDVYMLSATYLNMCKDKKNKFW